MINLVFRSIIGKKSYMTVKEDEETDVMFDRMEKLIIDPNSVGHHLIIVGVIDECVRFQRGKKFSDYGMKGDEMYKLSYNLSIDGEESKW